MKQINKHKFILSGGGTGGHIYPAIAIANALKLRYPNAEILFVGAKGKMEMEKVPQAGYCIKGLWISGIQRKLTFSNLLFPLKMFFSLCKAFWIIKKFKPSVVIGTGGFASGPTLLMANWMRKSTLVQEQNSYPGITNKFLGKKAKKVCVAYDNLERFFPKNLIVKTGNPVRQDLLVTQGKKGESDEFFKLSPSKKTLLIVGGSLGAKQINVLIEQNLDFFKQQNVQIIWQCGKLYYQEYKKYNDFADVQVLQFISRMDYAYASADFIVSRAGASSVSEMCIVGKPTIFIPSPNVAEDHQTKNAKAVVQKNAAILLEEKDLSNFKALFVELLNNELMQKEISGNIKKMALPKATENIVNEVEKLLN